MSAALNTSDVNHLVPQVRLAKLPAVLSNIN